MTRIPLQFTVNNDSKIYHFSQVEIEQFMQLIREDERKRIENEEAKRTERPLTKNHLLFLKEMTEHFFSAKTEIHYSEIWRKMKLKYNMGCNDYCILKYFDLINPQFKSGFFKPTKLAFDFLDAKVTVPKFIYGRGKSYQQSEEHTSLHNIMINPPMPNWRRLKVDDK